MDVHNVYNQVQVKMLMKEDDCENIPAFEDVFRDDEEQDEEEDEEVIGSLSLVMLRRRCDCFSAICRSWLLWLKYFTICYIF